MTIIKRALIILLGVILWVVFLPPLFVLWLFVCFILSVEEQLAGSSTTWRESFMYFWRAVFY